MSDKWPTLNDQLSAVLGAPIPFFIAVAFIAWAAWLAWRWRFEAVFEKQKQLYELSRLEVDHWKANAEITAKELAEKIGQLEKQQNLKQGDTKKQWEQAREAVAALDAQLSKLGRANNSAIATGTISTRSTSPSRSSTDLDWTSSGWRRRNPTDSTGSSG